MGRQEEVSQQLARQGLEEEVQEMEEEVCIQEGKEVQEGQEEEVLRQEKAWQKVFKEEEEYAMRR